MVNERVFQALAEESHVIGTFGHGFTYSGHPVPAAVAIETLKIYDELNIGAHVNERRRRTCRPNCAAASPTIALVGEVRGVGLIARDRAGGRQGRARQLRPEAEDRRAPDQAVRGERRDRPRAEPAMCWRFSPPLIITDGRDRRDAGRRLEGARRADRASCGESRWLVTGWAEACLAGFARDPWASGACT